MFENFQNITGKEGVYEQWKESARNALNLTSFHKTARSKRYAPPAYGSLDQVFWQKVGAGRKPMYGADINGISSNHFISCAVAGEITPNKAASYVTSLWTTSQFFNLPKYLLSSAYWGCGCSADI